MSHVVGIDATKYGWVAVAIDGEQVSAHALRTVGDVAAIAAGVEVIGIDMPIGLPESAKRQSDGDVQRFLGRRRNSLFNTPLRAALLAPTHEEASAVTRLVTGSGLSRQSYGLRHKILEVEQWLPDATAPVYEVHPEMSFAFMLGAPAASSKKTWAGMVERHDALQRGGIVLDGLEATLAASLAAVDDMLDAAAVAWSARRLAAGTARSFPDPPEPGPGGRDMAVWV